MLRKLTTWAEHPTYAAIASAKSKAKRRGVAEATAKPRLGQLPEWNLADLYKGPESPELKADLETSERAADAMQERYAGKLADLLQGGNGGASLAQAVREFEAVSDMIRKTLELAEN